MNTIEKIKASKNIATMVLAAIGIGIVYYYTTCETSCTYLQGDIFGIDLKYIGIAYMSVIFILAALRQMAYTRALLAMGLGIEVYLIAFQFKEDVFCLYCLAFASVIIVAFILNYERPISQENSLWKKLIYLLGEAELPPAGKIKVPLLVFAFLGYILIVLTFSGSVTPAYGAERSLVPSYGRGKYELIIFTDYFCPPCQLIESEIDPALTEFLSRGGLKVTFIDFPGHKETPLYAKYFLYSARAGTGYESALHVRRVLFSLAKKRSALTEEELKMELTTQGVSFTLYDLAPIYPELNKIMGTYKIKSTPTCVIKYSSNDIRKYTGTFEIRNGLGMLRATLGTNKR